MVMGKATGIAAAIVRGVDPQWLREGSIKGEVVRAAAEDLFR
jgi:coenzyme F420-0:L-glutamate ligase / coenzyme F420-1:gamma-L-glutamate ligase